jgi:hypothetical protein
MEVLAQAMNKLWFEEQDGRQAAADDRTLFGTITAHDLIR